MDFRSRLTPLQQGMLVRSIDKDSRSYYVIQTVFAWEEPIDTSLFQAAWLELAKRHEVLRSRFQWKDTPVPLQLVSPDVTFHLESSLSIFSDFLDSDLERGFALLDSPPWRVTTLPLPDGRITAVWTFHHLLLDGRSHALLLRELLAIYDGFRSGVREPGAPEVPHRAQADWLAQQDFTGVAAYWKQHLQGIPSTAFPAPLTTGKAVHTHCHYESRFESALTSDLKRFASASGVSAGNIIQACWAFLLGWLANQNDVVIGAVRACRKSGVTGGEDLVGLMINTVPLRIQWTRDSTIRSVLKTLAADWYALRDYEQTPLQEIQKWMELPSGTELFSTAVSFSAPFFLEAILPGEQERKQRHIWLRQTTPYCSLNVGLGQDHLFVSVSVPEGQVEPALARRLPEFLAAAVAAVIAHPDAKVGELSALSPADRTELIFGLNNRWEPAPAELDWMQRIGFHASRHPPAIAIQSSDESISWQDLEHRSNQVAAFLARQGIGPNALVAVFLPRSPEFIWTCLGIMKASAAYLPIDFQWPAQRVFSVLAEAGVAGIITNASQSTLLAAQQAPVWLQAQFALEAGTAASNPLPLNDQLAYVIYTSGSSGVPKGVEITHLGLQNLIEDAAQQFGITHTDRGSFLSNTAFDASVHEIWPVLASGGSIHLPDAELLSNPVGLLRWMGEQQITIAFVSVIIAEAITGLARGRAGLALRHLLTGADKLRFAAVAGLPFQLVNEYGPTEYSVVATRYPVTSSFDGTSTIPIGKPARGTRAYIMNQWQQLVPRGLAGELVLAGHGTARGYRNQPGLTAEKFISNPVSEERAPVLYRTGDLVRWQEDGNLQFLGRIDSQVKMRGFRIELGEIEASLLKHPAAAEAVVIMKHDPSPRLVAFIVPIPAQVPGELEAILTQHLRATLPDYMLPAQFVFREQLPINTSGKYDRKLLAALPPQQSEAKLSGPSEFESKEGEQMAGIWCEVLSLPSVQPDDRFLSLGGTSLSIIKLICAIDRQFGAELPVAEFFRDPTPDDLARLINTGSSKPQALVELSGPKIGAPGTGHPVFFIPGAGGGIHWFRGLAAELEAALAAGIGAVARPIAGIELLALSQATQAAFSVEQAASEITTLILRLPGVKGCSLCGYSGGGLLALECARRLKGFGLYVETVFLLDTYLPPLSSSTLQKAMRWARGWWSLPPRERWLTLYGRLVWFQQHRRASNAPVTQTQKELLAIKQVHIDAFMQHRLQPYDGSVNLFFAADRPLSVRTADDRDWATLLTGPFQITRLPGDHYSLLQAENARSLAAAFAQTLNQGTGRSPNPTNVYASREG